MTVVVAVWFSSLASLVAVSHKLAPIVRLGSAALLGGMALGAVVRGAATRVEIGPVGIMIANFLSTTIAPWSEVEEITRARILFLPWDNIIRTNVVAVRVRGRDTVLPARATLTKRARNKVLAALSDEAERRGIPMNTRAEDYNQDSLLWPFRRKKRRRRSRKG